MPLTDKGQKILAAMIEKYGEEEGTKVFYASRNKGTITGVDSEPEDFIDSISLTDSFILDGVHRSKDGYLAAYAKVARTGIQTYKGRELGRPDLGDVKVYRSPEEVFSKDAMHSMAHRPVTLHHPNETVNARNWKKYAKGHTGDEVIRDGDHIRVPVVVMDAETIQAFENKDACELSMGYSTDLKWTPGETPDGMTYDAVQTAIRANHLAIVPVARGGSTLKLGDQNDELSADELAVGAPELSFRDLVQRMNDNVVEMEDDEECPSCGGMVPEEDDVCPHCGHDMNEDMMDAILEDEHLEDFNPYHGYHGWFSTAEEAVALKELSGVHGVTFRKEGKSKGEMKFFHTPSGGIEHGPFHTIASTVTHAAGVVGAIHINVPETAHLSPNERRRMLRTAKRAEKTGSTGTSLVPYSGGVVARTGTVSATKTTPGQFGSKHEAKEFIRKNRRIWNNARVVTKKEKTTEPFKVPRILGGEPAGYALANLGISHKSRKKSFYVHHDSNELLDEQLSDDDAVFAIELDDSFSDEVLEDSFVDVIEDEVFAEDYDPNQPRAPDGRWTAGELSLAGFHVGHEGRFGHPDKGFHVTKHETGFKTGPQPTKEAAIERANELLRGTNPQQIFISHSQDPKQSEKELKTLGYEFKHEGGLHSVSNELLNFHTGPEPEKASVLRVAINQANFEQAQKHKVRLSEFQATQKSLTEHETQAKTAEAFLEAEKQVHQRVQISQPTQQVQTTPAITAPKVISPTLSTQAGSQFIARKTPTEFVGSHGREDALAHIKKEIAYWKSAKVLHTKVVEKTPFKPLPTVLGGKKLGNLLAGAGIAHRAVSHHYSIINRSHDSAVADAEIDCDLPISNDSQLGVNVMAKTITIDSVPVETTDVGAAVIQRHVAKLEGDLKTLQDAWNDKKKKDDEEDKAACDAQDGLTKQVQAKDGEIAVLKKQLEDALAAANPERLDQLVKDRSDVIDAARHVLDSRFVFDGKKVEDIRRSAVSTKLGDAVAKDMSDAAVEGAFKALTMDAKAANSGGTRPIARAIYDQQSSGIRPGTTDMRDAAFAEQGEYLKNAWRGGNRPNTGNGQ